MLDRTLHLVILYHETVYVFYIGCLITIIQYIRLSSAVPYYSMLSHLILYYIIMCYVTLCYMRPG